MIVLENSRTVSIYPILLIPQGENIKFIQSQLGHASIQTTLDRYGHILPSNQQGVGKRLDRQLFGDHEAGVLKPSFVNSRT